jgi:hypothetical protein
VTPAELLAATSALATSGTARLRGYCPHTPHPKQAEFLALRTREALYGGAAGGGKSDALLMAALEHVHVPTYSALLLRRTYADLALPGAIMDRAATWLAGTDATWNGTDKRWTFPSGATLSFGYLDTDKDRFRYASAEFQFIGFDELTQFPEQWYRFLFSRLRRQKGVNVPLRMRAATNPGGLGHEWVRRRFVSNPDSARPFVPALLVDNPSLDADEYLESLAELDSTTRAQLEKGVWVRDAEGLVYRYDEGINSLGTAPACDYKLLGLDFGVTDDCAFVVLGWRRNDPTVYVLEAFRRPDTLPPDAAVVVRELQQRHRFVRIVGDVGGLGKPYAEEMRRRHHIPVEPADKVNKRGFISLLNGDLERGRVKAQRGTCDDLITEWCELPWDEGRMKEAEGFDNHCFVAGTQIATAAGPVPVEGVRPGMLVHTRSGLRGVVAAAATRMAETYEIVTEAGRVLRGTADHPVWTGLDWKPLALLTPGIMLSVWESTGASRLLCSTESGSGATRTLPIEAFECTSQASEDGACIAQSGSPIVDRSLPASTYITSTATRRTTASITWRSSSGGNIFASTCSPRSAGPPAAPVCASLRSLPLSGIALKRGDDGISSTGRGHGSGAGWSSESVSSAVVTSAARSLPLRCAVMRVAPSADATRASTTSGGLAPNVPASFSRTDTASSGIARDRVLRVARTGCVENVYNLSVAGVPEYFANGILVHNCADAMLYAWRAANAFTQTAEEDGPPPAEPEQVQRKHDESKRRFLEGLAKQRRREQAYGRAPPTHRKLGH